MPEGFSHSPHRCLLSRFPRWGQVLGTIVLGVSVSSCANTTWGNQVGQALSIPSPGVAIRSNAPETPRPTASLSPRPTIVESPVPNPSPGVALGPDIPETIAPNPGVTPTISPAPFGTPTGDLNTADPSQTNAGQPVGKQSITALPPALQTPVDEVLGLGVISLEAGAQGWEAPVSRRQFARWLFGVSNRLYSDRPARQIRPGDTNSTPLFTDVPSTDPDFDAIQGLAQAGLIPSSLGGNSNVSQFQPEAPLTREQLVLWKVPLDTRQPIPATTIDRIENTWGFQDSDRISGNALGAIWVDYQNDDQANIRRVFGYTTLLQPQKPVTLGEAIAALAYFGFQGQGISASTAPPISAP